MRSFVFLSSMLDNHFDFRKQYLFSRATSFRRKHVLLVKLLLDDARAVGIS